MYAPITTTSKHILYARASVRFVSPLVLWVGLFWLGFWLGLVWSCCLVSRRFVASSPSKVSVLAAKPPSPASASTPSHPPEDPCVHVRRDGSTNHSNRQGHSEGVKTNHSEVNSIFLGANQWSIMGHGLYMCCQKQLPSLGNRTLANGRKTCVHWLTIW